MPAVIGHQAIVQDFEKLIKRGALSHGYIFYGGSMVGKRTTALALANFLEKGKFEVPEEGEVLQDSKMIDLAFAKQLDPDLKDSISIDAVREIKNFLWQRPNVSARRTLIIDEAELLTSEAQSALLKITEEPPVSSLLLVVTSDIEGMMGTIRSRLQGIYFGSVPEKEIATWLGAKNAAIAKKALGKPGLARRLANDEEFQKILALADKFLHSTAAGRKDLVKKILEPDDFNLRLFLDAVIINLAWEKTSAAKIEIWHRALALQRDTMNFGLNPRLQLENLLIK